MFQFKSVFRKQFELTLELSRRELHERFIQNHFGLLWMFVKPTVISFVYIYIFSNVIKIKLNIDNSEINFGLYFLSGFACWLYISELVTNTMSSIEKRADMVKQVKFDYVCIPIAAAIPIVIFQLFFCMLALTFKIYYLGFNFGNFLLLPALIIQYSFMLGIIIIVAVHCAKWQDLKEIINLFFTVGLFATPVLYLPESLGVIGHWIIYLNPLSHMIYIFQDAILNGKITHIDSWIFCSLISLPLTALCIKSYRKNIRSVQDEL